MQEKSAVEWLVDQMKQRANQGLNLSMYELEMFAEKAKEMEEDKNHKAYMYGLESGFSKSEQNIPKSGNNRSEELKGCACYGSNSLHPCFCDTPLKDKS